MVLDETDRASALVGRGAELRALTAALERAAAGCGRLVAVTGEAGIGKTRLLEELVRASGLPASGVLRGRCPEQIGAPSYWPWTRILRAHAAARGVDALRAELGTAAERLAALVPGLAPSNAAPPAPAGEQETRYAMFAAVSSLLRGAAATAPLLVLLEDVHWADEGSLALLEFLAQELEGTRLLLVITYRERERPSRPRALRTTLRTAVRHGQRIALRGLDGDAVAELIERTSGGDAARTLAPRLAELTGGNPFYLVEVLRALEQEGRLDSLAVDTPLGLPDSVRDSIRRHLEPIPPEDRDLLAVAAVAGESFAVDLLAQVLDGDATAVRERLHAAVARGFIVERAGGRFRFAHALLRETIYGDLLPATRVHLHARVGEALEKLHGGDGHGAPLGILARHFLHAGPLGTAAKAVRYATRAAQEAAGVLAHHDALAFYEQALAALGADPGDQALRLSLRLAAADVASRAGLDRRACELFLLAAQDARARGDRGALSHAAAGYYVLRPNIAERDPQTIPLLEEALAACDDGDGTARATLLALLSTVREAPDGGRASEATGAEAVAMARRIGDPGVLATTLLARQLVLTAPGSTDVRLALADEALALAMAGAHGVEHLARAARVHCLLERGDVAEATDEIERMASAASRLRRSDRQAQVLVRRASVALLEGRFDDGARLAAEALGTRRSADDPTALQNFVLQMFLARRDTGYQGGLEGSLRWMVEQHPDRPTWPCVLAVLLADLGRAGEARAIFDGIASGGFARLARQHNHGATLAWMARVCAFLRDVPRARELYPMLLPYAEQNIVLGASSQACLGSAQRYLGLLAATLGEVDAAERHYQAAIALNERMGARPVVACTQHEYARLLQHRDGPGDRARARLLLEQARATSLVCGMTQLLDWIERLGPIPAADTVTPPGAATIAPYAAAIAPSAGSAPAAEANARATLAAILRRDGDVWLVGFAGEVARMKDARGVRLLATLLRHPGQEIHVLDLAGGGPGAADVGAVVDRGDAGPLLDASARAAYKRRLEDLREQLDEAERFNDPLRAERARHEIDFLAGELSRGVGLGGRDRRAASAAERARVNATRTIGGAVKRIAGLNPRLGEHLRATVRTGYLCVYAPDPTSPVRWET